MFAMGPAFFKQAGGYATLALTGAFAPATVGAAYSSSIPITGGLEPYSLTGGAGVGSGSLDSGFALSITGTTGARFLTLACASPATADTMAFTASVGSTDGQTATSAQSVTVVTGVVSLLNMGGADGSTVFTDATGKAWTAAGAAQIDTSLGYNAALFSTVNGADRISTPHHSDFDFGSGDFMIRAWLRSANPGSVNHVPIICHDNIAVQRGWLFFCDKDQGGKLSFAAFNGAVSKAVTAPSIFPANTMTYVEVGRSGNTMYLSQGGTIVATTDVTGFSINNPSISVFCGTLVSSSAPNTGLGGINGWIRALEVFKGIGPHTSSFTPPSAPFPLP